MDSRLRLHGASTGMGSRCHGGAGGTGMGPRIREDNGRGRVPVCVFTGASCERGKGTGMGAHMREDNGRGRVPVYRLHGGKL